ncbi:general transcription factor 3c polypeptide [Anaeramoeba flamelloides]|uniref:General transcription factor 3c polypeptide n=1 Tax=Anaeramoeba flamelloides TaxID=1746091 RepID=A0AAV7ZRN2_9EUKA|nr:general transcription factor 3c polypeptide [Anaeramoeba flamelloides]
MSLIVKNSLKEISFEGSSGCTFKRLWELVPINNQKIKLFVFQQLLNDDLQFYQISEKNKQKKKKMEPHQMAKFKSLDQINKILVIASEDLINQALWIFKKPKDNYSIRQIKVLEAILQSRENGISSIEIQKKIKITSSSFHNIAKKFISKNILTLHYDKSEIIKVIQKAIQNEPNNYITSDKLAKILYPIHKNVKKWKQQKKWLRNKLNVFQEKEEIEIFYIRSFTNYHKEFGYKNNDDEDDDDKDEEEMEIKKEKEKETKIKIEKEKKKKRVTTLDEIVKKEINQLEKFDNNHNKSQLIKMIRLNPKKKVEGKKEVENINKFSKIDRSILVQITEIVNNSGKEGVTTRDLMKILSITYRRLIDLLKILNDQKILSKISIRNQKSIQHKYIIKGIENQTKNHLLNISSYIKELPEEGGYERITKLETNRERMQMKAETINGNDKKGNENEQRWKRERKKIKANIEKVVKKQTDEIMSGIDYDRKICGLENEIKQIDGSALKIKASVNYNLSTERSKLLITRLVQKMKVMSFSYLMHNIRTFNYQQDKTMCDRKSLLRYLKNLEQSNKIKLFQLPQIIIPFWNGYIVTIPDIKMETILNFAKNAIKYLERESISRRLRNKQKDILRDKISRKRGKLKRQLQYTIDKLQKVDPRKKANSEDDNDSSDYGFDDYSDYFEKKNNTKKNKKGYDGDDDADGDGNDDDDDNYNYEDKDNDDDDKKEKEKENDLKAEKNMEKEDQSENKDNVDNKNDDSDSKRMGLKKGHAKKKHIRLKTFQKIHNIIRVKNAKVKNFYYIYQTNLLDKCYIYMNFLRNIEKKFMANGLIYGIGARVRFFHLFLLEHLQIIRDTTNFVEKNFQIPDIKKRKHKFFQNFSQDLNLPKIHKKNNGPLYNPPTTDLGENDGLINYLIEKELRELNDEDNSIIFTINEILPHMTVKLFIQIIGIDFQLKNYDTIKNKKLCELSEKLKKKFYNFNFVRVERLLAPLCQLKLISPLKKQENEIKMNTYKIKIEEDQNEYGNVDKDDFRNAGKKQKNDGDGDKKKDNDHTRKKRKITYYEFSRFNRNTRFRIVSSIQKKIYFWIKSQSMTLTSLRSFHNLWIFLMSYCNHVKRVKSKINFKKNTAKVPPQFFSRYSFKLIPKLTKSKKKIIFENYEKKNFNTNQIAEELGVSYRQVDKYLLKKKLKLNNIYGEKIDFLENYIQSREMKLLTESGKRVSDIINDTQKLGPDDKNKKLHLLQSSKYFTLYPEYNKQIFPFYQKRGKKEIESVNAFVQNGYHTTIENFDQESNKQFDKQKKKKLLSNDKPILINSTKGFLQLFSKRIHKIQKVFNQTQKHNFLQHFNFGSYYDDPNFLKKQIIFSNKMKKETKIKKLITHCFTLYISRFPTITYSEFYYSFDYKFLVYCFKLSLGHIAKYIRRSMYGNQGNKFITNLINDRNLQYKKEILDLLPESKKEKIDLFQYDFKKDFVLSSSFKMLRDTTGYINKRFPVHIPLSKYIKRELNYQNYGQFEKLLDTIKMVLMHGKMNPFPGVISYRVLSNYKNDEINKLIVYLFKAGYMNRKRSLKGRTQLKLKLVPYTNVDIRKLEDMYFKTMNFNDYLKFLNDNINYQSIDTDLKNENDLKNNKNGYDLNHGKDYGAIINNGISFNMKYLPDIHHITLMNIVNNCCFELGEFHLSYYKTQKKKIKSNILFTNFDSKNIKLIIESNKNKGNNKGNTNTNNNTRQNELEKKLLKIFDQDVPLQLFSERVPELNPIIQSLSFIYNMSHLLIFLIEEFYFSLKNSTNIIEKIIEIQFQFDVLFQKIPGSPELYLNTATLIKYFLKYKLFEKKLFTNSSKKILNRKSNEKNIFIKKNYKDYYPSIFCLLNDNSSEKISLDETIYNLIQKKVALVIFKMPGISLKMLLQKMLVLSTNEINMIIRDFKKIGIINITESYYQKNPFLNNKAKVTNLFPSENFLQIFNKYDLILSKTFHTNYN